MRAECRPAERRAGITPQGARELVAEGFTVVVEESSTRVFPIGEYAKAGCEIASPESWRHAREDAFIFGLKELPEDDTPLRHRHIMFGHAFKGQSSATKLLERFKLGGGTLYDLEYLLDDSRRRVAAFGYWAGYAGAAVALMAFWAHRSYRTIPDLTAPRPNRVALREEVANSLGEIPDSPCVIIIGMGRTGSGAAELCKSLGLRVTGYDLPDTEHGGPFPEILEHDIFLNCVLAGPETPEFIPISAISSSRRLSVVGDIACDPASPFNPVPIYSQPTSFAAPMIRLHDAPPLYLTAIDNLPSLLPLESSEDFSGQLLPSLKALNKLDGPPWSGALAEFRRHLLKN